MKTVRLLGRDRVHALTKHLPRSNASQGDRAAMRAAADAVRSGTEFLATEDLSALAATGATFPRWWTRVALLFWAAGCAAPPPAVSAPTELAAHAPSAHCHARGDLPDPVCTPGDVETADLHVICGQSTRERRNVTESEKRAALEAYGVHRAGPGDLEVDHLVPLCGGGSNAQVNLWAEPAPAFHEKDAVEARMCRAICDGSLDVHEAQREIARDWRALERRLGR